MRKLAAILMALMVAAGVLCAFAEDGAAQDPVGGWKTAADPEVTEERMELFTRGMEGLLGVHYTPVVYLGSQEDEGTCHAFLCRAAVVRPNAEPFWAVVFLQEDAEGNVSLRDIAEFDPAALLTRGEE